MKTFQDHCRELLVALPESVRRTGIIGGGALRSYFDGTPIKDIDVFFRTPEDFNSAVMDLDLFYDVEWRLVPCNKNGSSRFPTYEHAVDGLKINLVGFRFGTPSELVESFDFTCVSMVAWVGQHGAEYIAPDPSVFAACRKKLIVNRLDPLKRLEKRVAHYVDDYGYSPPDDYEELKRAAALVTYAGGESDYPGEG